MAKRNFYVDVDLNGNQLLCGSIAATLITSTDKRQTVLHGSVDSAGFPNALTPGTGLAVALTATGTPVDLSFAAGFSGGALDYPGRITANQTFSGLTASTTCFLFIDRSATGTLTTGFTTLVPVYATIAPSSPAIGQHWFNLNAFLMQRWSGSAWVSVQRVFVGEAVTGSSAVTSAITYAYRGRYQSAWLSVAANLPYVLNHNFGIPLVSAHAIIGFYSSIAGNDADAMPLNAALPTAGFLGALTFYGYQLTNNAAGQRNIIAFRTLDFVAMDSTGAWQSAAKYRLNVVRGW